MIPASRSRRIERERDVPVQAYHRYIEFDARRNLRFEQLAIRRRRDQVDAEALKSSPSQRLHFGRIRATGSRTMPRKPKAPAALTAATSSDRATPPIPAATIG